MSAPFVWTFEGVMQAAFLCVVLAIGLGIAVLVAVDRVQRWWRNFVRRLR